MIIVRPAIALDASSMARLLNAIIEEGGTTAIANPSQALIYRIGWRPMTGAPHGM